MRFCGECGTALDAGRHLPPPLVLTPIAERRTVSVVFGDLVGFTPLSESRDVEDVRELLSRYFVQARTVISRYGGVVEKFIGDAVMAVWGVPVAHEDDAERAVRAGLDVVAAVAALREDVGVPDLAVRVGIVTGEVAVTIGATGEGMVAGDAVNTAARIQAAAAPGVVLVDEATKSVTASSVSYSDAGQHSLKGKAEPSRLWQARAVVAGVAGAQRVDGLEAPFTGRDRELRLVKELFHATAEDGRPRLVLIEAAAGLGKSRLSWEFEKYCDGLSDTLRWHRGRCLSYGEGVAFWALAEAVRGRLGVTDVDGIDVVRERLAEAVARFVGDPQERKWIEPRLAVLLGLSEEASFARADLFAAWTAFLERVGEDRYPVVLVLDDAQYADDGLLDFLQHLVETARAGVFVLLLTRPELLEHRPDLGAGRRVTVLHLEPLGAPAMATLVEGLVDALPDRVRDSLVARSEGVPLYAVETVRMLIDRDAVIPREGRYALADPGGDAIDLARLEAPASLHALVASRLDALAPAERRIVQDASVLGASFPRSALDALAGDVPDVDAVLDALARKEVLTRQVDPFSASRGQYQFVQAVVRQVAYETLSRRDRRERHLVVARYLGGLPDPGDELAAVAAQHYLDAVDAGGPGQPGNPELVARARELLERAAGRAERLGSPVEAHRHFLSALARSDEPADRARLEEGAARAALAAGLNDEAGAHAVRAAATYDAMGRPYDAARAAAITAQAQIAQHKLREAVALLEPRWQALEADPDAGAAVLPMAEALALAHNFLSEFRPALAYAERALRLADATRDYPRLVGALNRYAVIWAFDGVPTAARGLLDLAASLARDHQLPHALLRPLVNIAALDLSRDLPNALRSAREALDVARQVGYAREAHFATLNLMVALRFAGRWAELRDLLESMDDTAPDAVLTVVVQWWWLATASGAQPPDVPDVDPNDYDDIVVAAWAQYVALIRAWDKGDSALVGRLAADLVSRAAQASGLDDDFPHHWPFAVEAALECGLHDVAEELLRHVANAPPGLVTPYLHAQLLRLRGQLALARGETASGEAELRAAVAALREFGAVPDRARTEVVLAAHLLRGGRFAEAESLLASARATFADLGATAWLAAADELTTRAPTGVAR